MLTLYGDGIHDDTRALQERIDGAGCELALPAPKVRYRISAPLELPSRFRLTLPRFAEIWLAPGSNCVMLKNKTQIDHANRGSGGIFDYVNAFSPDAFCEDIEVSGGIWNANNLGQAPNPMLIPLGDGNYTWGAAPKPRLSDAGDGSYDYTGFIFLFYAVRGLRLSSMTLKDPVTFAVMLDRVSDFTVDHITFDFNYGNPRACNMDGIHLNGGCCRGYIADLKGACFDDLVALNADEGIGSPIHDIVIRGIHAEDCHSAVRLLSANHAVRNVHISDVFGTFFQYTVGLTRFYESKDRGLLENITLENLFVSKAPKLPVYNHNFPGEWEYAVIHADSRLNIRNLRISNLRRREQVTPLPTLYFSSDTVIERLFLEDIVTENLTGGGTMPLLENHAELRGFHAAALYEDGKPFIPAL